MIVPVSTSVYFPPSMSTPLPWRISFEETNPRGATAVAVRSTKGSSCQSQVIFTKFAVASTVRRVPAL
ncbi:hypothetical protein T484DRAFT_1934415, partial [Baffinella frigidus]